MKKLLVIILSLVLCFPLCACEGNGKATESTQYTPTIQERAVDKLKINIMVKIAVLYDTVGSPDITYYVEETSENEFEITGKVTVHDKYGDSYTGKYDAVVKYDNTTDEFDIKSDIDTLYKN